MTPYPHLFSPLRIGNAVVRNRIMQTAHIKLFAHNAVDSERNVAYQAARARGGAGLLVTGNRLVHPTSTTGFPRAAWAFLPEALEADRKLTDAVHEHGALIFAQLNHFVERLRRRLPRALGPVGGQVARVRRDAEGDGAGGHRGGRRLVGALGRADA
jgi:2,4-dienoyl-CoA reductase-like NADH-dependent reductase (Old Yellow Enzyme family)